MRYAEITKEAFNALGANHTEVSMTEQLEHAFKIHYRVLGVKLLQIDNYLSNVSQYYIEDINY